MLEDWDRQTREMLVSAGRTGLAFFEAIHELMNFHLQHRALLELFITMTAEATSVTPRSRLHPASLRVGSQVVGGPTPHCPRSRRDQSAHGRPDRG